MKKLYILIYIILLFLVLYNVLGANLDYTTATTSSEANCNQFAGYNLDDIKDRVMDSTAAGDAAFTTNAACPAGPGWWNYTYSDSYFFQNITLNMIGCGSAGARQYKINITINETQLGNGWTTVLDSFVVDCTSGYNNVTILENYNFSSIRGNAISVRFYDDVNYNGILISELLVNGTSSYPFLVDLVSPENNTLNNTNTISFEYNVTSEKGEISECDLWTNMTGIWAINTSNQSAVINNSLNYFNNIIFSTDGTYIWNINCSNSTDNVFGEDNLTLVIDTTSPVLTTNFTNRTVRLSNNLTGQFNFSDNNLIHTVNITIPTANVRILDQTNISQSLFIYNMSYNITNISAGTHILNIRYADGGTGKALKEDYDFSNGLFNDYSRYDFPDGGYIKTESKTKTVADDWISIRKEDRYIQVFEPTTPSSSYTFVEESDMPIYILNNQGHHGDTWIVIGNHWKDYVVEGEDQKVSVKRINKYMVEVTVSNILNNQERLTFNSVGDLNVVEKNYTFGKTNGTVTYSIAVTDFETQTISLSIGMNGGVTSSNANLTYNGTLMNTTKITSSGFDTYSSTFETTPLNTTQANISNRTIIWDYNISGPVDMEIGNITLLQEVSSAMIDNCSGYTTGAINFTTKRDDTYEDIISELDGFFTISVPGGTSDKSFNLTWDRNTTHGLCIFPSSGSYDVSAQFEYKNNSFSTKTYYFYNNTLDNETDNITLYFTPNTTLVTFIVTDQNDDYLQGLYINILKYDITTDSSTVSEVLRTDEQGQALGNIVLDTQWYKFLLVLDNRVVLETEPTKITSTSKYFRVNLQTDFYDIYDTFNGILVTLTFENTTKNFAYTFINPTGSSVKGCLEVTEQSFVENNVINTSCQTTSAATINIVIGSDTDVANKSYVARGTIQTNANDDNTRFVAATLGVSFNELFKVWGTSGLWLIFFVRVALVMMGIWFPVVAILLMFVGDIGLYWMGIFNMGPFVVTTYAILALITMWKVGKTR